MDRHTLLYGTLALTLSAGVAFLGAQTPPEKVKEQTKEAGSAIKDAAKETGKAAAEVGKAIGAAAKGVAKGTVAAGKAMKDAVANELSDDEKRDGWTLLFNGRSLEGWRAFTSATPPTGWEIRDGVLARTGAGGDLMTVGQYDNFMLDLDYRIAVGGNSGIMYRVTTDGDRPYYSGPEYQILDNERHADAKNGRDRYAGANYALHPPETDAGNPAGEWNNARIVVNGNFVEHWLNGEKVVAYELHSDDWTKRVAASKFAEWPMYGKASRGHIVLQDHGDLVEFRNIKIKEID
jgi:hypothetical protein